ncbi:MAG: T9SS type A sorting domain-containing protein, partial [Chitinophagales bacterium]
NTWEEIDFMPVANGGGQNYGWDCYEGTHNFEPGNCSVNDVITWPVYEYQHCTGSNCDCSLTGGYVYRGAQYANLYGKYVCVDYCSGKFRATTQNTNGTFTTALVGDEIISQDEFAFSTFGQDHLGELYVANVTNGKIYNVTDTACLPVAKILANNDGSFSLDSAVCVGTELHAVAATGNTYQWQLDNVNIIGATSPVYVAGEVGVYTFIVTNGSGCSNISQTVTTGLPTQPAIEGIDPFYCDLSMPDTLIGNPQGGTFDGDGMNGAVFSPAVAGLGVHIITYTYVNFYGCSAIQTATISVDVCEGVTHLQDNDDLKIFPMPNNGTFTISFNNPAKEIAELSIFSLSGKLIMPLAITPSLSGTLTFNVQPLADAMYLLRIKTGNDVVYRKLVIEN